MRRIPPRVGNGDAEGRALPPLVLPGSLVVKCCDHSLGFFMLTRLVSTRVVWTRAEVPWSVRNQKKGVEGLRPIQLNGKMSVYRFRASVALALA